MDNQSSPPPATQRLLQSLAAKPCITSLGPIAGRFIYALRLIAVHERVGRDPVPELANRLQSVDVAARALVFSQAIRATWPENVQVSCFCSSGMTHDEATIGALVDCATNRDLSGFERQIDGLIRPSRVHRLWLGAIELVAAEAHGA